MMNSKVFGDRLKAAMHERGISYERLSSDIKVSVSGLRKWAGGQTDPSLLNAVAAAEALGVGIEWLATGRGEMLLQRAMTRSLAERSDATPARSDEASDLVHLPLLNVTASAGAGAVVEYEDIDRMLAFGRDWLRRHHITPHAAQVLTAKGDSMEPTIRTGDLLIVDTDITTPVDSGIYVVNYDGSLLVKRLFLLRNGGLLISSDNKIAGREEELTREDLYQLRIIGRVMWYGRDI